MATAHAKFTGEVGCCTATSLGGAIHLLNGLYDVELVHQPVVHRRTAEALSIGAAFQQGIRPELFFTTARPAASSRSSGCWST